MDRVGSANADLVELSLEPSVIQKADLHRLLSGEPPLEQLGDALSDLFLFAGLEKVLFASGCGDFVTSPLIVLCRVNGRAAS